MNILNLSYEYNEYVIGYIVTDSIIGRFVNFQFDKANTNHPQPAQILGYAREGDETSDSWNKEELEYITSWLRSKTDADSLEDCMTIIMNDDEKKEKFNEMACTGQISESEIRELAESA